MEYPWGPGWRFLMESHGKNRPSVAHSEATLKESWFLVQRVAKIVASRAVSKPFFSLSLSIFFFFFFFFFRK